MGGPPMVWVRRKQWHGFPTHGLAVLRKRRPYSADTSKSAAFLSYARARRCAWADIGCADTREYTSPRAGRPCHKILLAPKLPAHHRLHDPLLKGLLHVLNGFEIPRFDLFGGLAHCL